jgi:hypothetical protein
MEISNTPTDRTEDAYPTDRFGRESDHSLHSVPRVRMLKPFSSHFHGVLHD